MEVGEVSRKIDRGKHTTRHTELIVLRKDTYFLDTPGFSSLYLQGIGYEELKELKDENKQDKAMFASAVASFENSVREFTIMSSKMANLEHDVKEIRNDIRELKA